MPKKTKKKASKQAYIRINIYYAKRKKEKRKAPTKRAGPLKVLPKQCIWCSKNGHQMGAIKPLSAEKKKQKKKGGARSIAGSSPRSFNSTPSDERSLEKPLNSVGGRYLQFVPGSS